MTGMTGISLGVVGWLFLISWGMQTVGCEDGLSQFTICPELGTFYSTSPDCLIYYQCANNMVWTKVCFPWQRFDVHQMQCRDLKEVDCNPEFTGIWRPIYTGVPETAAGEEGLTIGEIPVQTLGETVTEDQTIPEESATELLDGLDNLSIEGEEEASNVQTEELETLKIVSSIETLDLENQVLLKKFNFLQMEEIQEEDVDYTFIGREDNIPIGNSFHKVKRYVPDDPLNSDGTVNIQDVNRQSQQDEKPKKMLKNVMLMNIDDQSINSVLNWFSSHQMMNGDHRGTGGSQMWTIGDTLTFDMSCAKPVTGSPSASAQHGGGQKPQNTGRPGNNKPHTTARPNNNANHGDSSGGYWYWCGSGRYVFTQSNNEGDRLCEQLQDPQFINQEGSTQQGGDWSGHTFLG